MEQANKFQLMNKSINEQLREVINDDLYIDYNRYYSEGEDYSVINFSVKNNTSLELISGYYSKVANSFEFKMKADFDDTENVISLIKSSCLELSSIE